jgi:type VI secretion system protein ImpE
MVCFSGRETRTATRYVSVCSIGFNCEGGKVAIRFPMNAKDLIRAGRLSEARTQLTEEVKSAPSDFHSRTLLFQLLCFFGEWDKAERHLEAISAQDVKAEIGMRVYKNLIHAEKERRNVTKLARRPSFVTETPPFLEMYLAAWEKLIGNKTEEASELYAQIESVRPGVSGTLNGKNFDGFRDLDTFLSCFLEAIVHERYVWIPFESMRELSVSPPKTLFDLLWSKANVTTWEGFSVNCYLPVLYPDSFLHEDDRVKLGRMTEWTSLGESFFKGMGQHIFQIGEEEIALLEIRDIVFNLPDSAGKG